MAEKLLYLKYLNIYEINTETNSLITGFNTFKNKNIYITICINNQTIIPGIFEILKNLPNSKRDCSNACYPITKYFLKNEFLCVDDFETTNLVKYTSEIATTYQENDISTYNLLTTQMNEKYTTIMTTENLESTNIINIITTEYTTDTITTEHILGTTEIINICHPDCETCEENHQ